MGIIVAVLIVYFTGKFVRTAIWYYFELVLSKLPIYSHVKDFINTISNQKDDDSTLVAIVFDNEKKSYRTGVISTKDEGTIEGYYIVSFHMSPIPNGGFPFEYHGSEIYIIPGARYEDNFKYLVSMGINTMPNILNRDSYKLSDLGTSKLPTLEDYLKQYRM